MKLLTLSCDGAAGWKEISAFDNAGASKKIAAVSIDKFFAANNLIFLLCHFFKLLANDIAVVP